MGTVRDTLIARVRALDELPAEGRLFLETERLLRGEARDAAEVAGILEKDIWLATRILRMANSVFYSGRYGEIGDLRQAVTRLGFDEICRIALAFKAVNLMPKSENDLVNGRDFWHHSIAVALTTRRLAAMATQADFDPGQAYTAGLLHDIGTLVLNRDFEPVYRKVRETAASSGEPVFQVERKLLDIDHSELGGILLTHWHFPEALIHGVSWHHDPDKAPAFLPLAQIVHLSDYACSAVGVPEPGDALPADFSYGAWHDLGLDADTVRRMVEEVEEEIAKTKILFNLM